MTCDISPAILIGENICEIANNPHNIKKVCLAFNIVSVDFLCSGVKGITVTVKLGIWHMPC